MQKRYWSTLALIGPLRVLAQMPSGRQRRVGAVLGWGLYYVMWHRRRIAARNIELCLFMLSLPEQNLWTHRRFKIHPPGEPPVYEQ